MAAEAPPAKRPRAARGARSAAEVCQPTQSSGTPPDGGGQAAAAPAAVHAAAPCSSSDGEDEYDHLVSGFRRRAQPDTCGSDVPSLPVAPACPDDGLLEPL